MTGCENHLLGQHRKQEEWAHPTCITMNGREVVKAEFCCRLQTLKSKRRVSGDGQLEEWEKLDVVLLPKQ